jgi:glycosyltransferase involved in cell wall biosynthesis
MRERGERLPEGEQPAGGSPSRRLEISALLPGVGVFGGVRRFIELGNALVRRGHRYVLYHPDGTRPGWLEFAGEVRPLAALHRSTHQVLLCGEPSLLPEFERANSSCKLFYCVLEKLPDERHIVRHAGWTILANSSGIRERLWRRYRVRAEDAIGGINLQMFHPVEGARQRAGESFRVLAYGRLSRSRKGTALAVRAAEILARRLSRRFPAWGGTLAHPVQLVLFDHLGPGNEADPRGLLRTRIPCEFHLDLPQDRLAELYSSCDVFVSAERRAGWNNTVAEAMACGVPVVCTSSGTRDQAVHRDTAWVVRFRQPRFLAAGLAALQCDPALRESLRRAALLRVSTLSWDRLAARLEAISQARLDPSLTAPEGSPSSL